MKRKSLKKLLPAFDSQKTISLSKLGIVTFVDLELESVHPKHSPVAKSPKRGQSHFPVIQGHKKSHNLQVSFLPFL